MPSLLYMPVTKTITCLYHCWIVLFLLIIAGFQIGSRKYEVQLTSESSARSFQPLSGCSKFKVLIAFRYNVMISGVLQYSLCFSQDSKTIATGKDIRLLYLNHICSQIPGLTIISAHIHHLQEKTYCLQSLDHWIDTKN